MRYLSPLRYPGGKARLAPFFARLKWSQREPIDTYAEPFAGGVGAGLRLLEEGHVETLLVNDLNPGIAAFWRSVVAEPLELGGLVRGTKVTVDEWHRQHQIYSEGVGDDLTLGFATFFLNRTNRSGILRGRPIGGFDQDGAWKIDARWNPESLCERIRAVAARAGQIVVCEQDALTFLSGLESPASTLAYVDPPYLAMGDRLYFSKFSREQHEALAQLLGQATFRWVLTYDAHDAVTDELYASQTCAEFGIDYSAQVRRVGKEYMVFSPDLELPDMQFTRMRQGSLVAG